MKITNLDLSKLQSESFQLSRNLNTMGIDQIFTVRRSAYVNEFNLFIAYYNVIPNIISELKIDCTRAHRWFIANCKGEVTDTYYNRRFLYQLNCNGLDNVFHFLHEDLMINFDNDNSIVRFLYRKTEIEKINLMVDSIKRFKQRKSCKPVLSLLVKTTDGIEITPLNINRTKLNIKDNYNDDFQEIHQTIMTRLSKKNDKGLVLLHGKPGTGKTSYIRYLIATLKKDVIFLPPNLASEMTNPDLIKVLIENTNSVLVIEDAENIVMNREDDSCSPVSALLNISDGLLSDCLNIQIICSFNTDISKVDDALMRRGRLIARYEFKELDLKKTQQLSKALGFETSLNEPMTLATIYNQTEQNFLQKKNVKTIGFKVSA